MPKETNKRIAEEYAEAYGAQLRAELDGMERGAAERATHALDGRVRSGIAEYKRARGIRGVIGGAQRRARYIGPIAACLAIALAAPLLLRLSSGQSAAPASDAFSGAAPAGTQAGAVPAAPSSAPSASSPSAAAPSAPLASPPSAPATAYELLPLSVALPAQFSIASVEQDVERTIYHLYDGKLDDVVLTMERFGDISRYDDLAALTIGGHGAFGATDAGYSLLAFSDDESDILYVLTCKHDINTLVLLSESILS